MAAHHVNILLQSRTHIPIARVYIAARYGRRMEALERALELQACGISVVSRWIRGEHAEGDGDESRWAVFAAEDLNDICQADTLILLSEGPTVARARNGNLTELGIAIGLGMRIIVIGPRQNTFCHLPCIEVYSTWAVFRRTWEGINRAGQAKLPGAGEGIRGGQAAGRGDDGALRRADPE